VFQAQVASALESICIGWTEVHLVICCSSACADSLRCHFGKDVIQKCVTALENTKVLRNNRVKSLVVLKELCFGMAETLGDVGKWWHGGGIIRCDKNVV
jgi:hypothetical protein